MTRIGFYHLQIWPLERALPKLLEKVIERKLKAVVMCGTPERVEQFNALLWTYEPDSWLPHGSARDGEAQLQPVWLTAEDENPNGATVLVLVDGVTSERLGSFERVLNLFNGNLDESLQQARRQWSAWKAQGHELVYHQQTESGGWTEQARHTPSGS
ncbi:MAG: DNA polymerase III subunit chi [Rhodospirillales bacterium]|nr:DNA polymerase III subunit chi [Rhodospirillales bacterium]